MTNYIALAIPFFFLLIGIDVPDQSGPGVWFVRARSSASAAPAAT
jgi:hypothetical protein